MSSSSREPRRTSLAPTNVTPGHAKAPPPPPRVLTVAGSDSGGGAGIQADIKTFTTLCVYGTAVVTVLSAQNTLGIQSIYPVPAAFVSQQMASVLEDIGTDAAKTGALYDAEIIEAVSVQFRAFRVRRLVVDPIMVSTSNHIVLAETAVSALRKYLIPLAEVITPSIREAEALTGMTIRTVGDVRIAARELHALGCANVVIKGAAMPVDQNSQVVMDPANAHGDVFSIDLLFNGTDFWEFPRPWMATQNIHGAGCALSSAITAGLANGLDVPTAVDLAVRFVANGQEHAFVLGKGRSTINHLPSAQLVPPPPTISKPTSFFEILLASCPREWHAYVHHPFVAKIADGTLPIESFRHFITQDYIFLRHYARAYALASYRESDMESITNAARHVAYIGQEVMMHVKLCESWGITAEQLEGTVEASANLAYSRYVLEKGMSGDRLDLRVALAPCLLGYGEIAQRLASDPNTLREGNAYWPWIDHYAKPEFQRACVVGFELLETLFKDMVPPTNIKRIAQLCDTFRQATILETDFWQSECSTRK
ncbi:hypothetical protein HKX48_009536 [Thoreauomyces humboldtii]|nr:hypothetical protein HKX48_009536 [Thoreauomyces humboldtii]